MFEQSVIANVPKGKRFWTTCLGVTGQAILVSGAVLSPMLWPQVLPPATFTRLVPTAPPGRRARPHSDAKPQTSATHRTASSGPVYPRVPYIPTNAPPIAVHLIDDLVEAPGVGIPDALAGPYGNGGPDTIGPWIGFPKEDGARQPQIAKTSKAVEPLPKPKEPTRVRVGGVVREPRLIRRVDPRYPQIAVTSHIEGVVKMEGLIGVDGRIRSLAVQSGNPLLAPAAMDAVRQWLYEPTL